MSTSRFPVGARLALGLVAAGLILAACAGSSSTTADADTASDAATSSQDSQSPGSPDTDPPDTDSPGPVSESVGPETRQVILDLALETYNGGDQFDPGTIKGKPVILWFWGAF